MLEFDMESSELLQAISKKSLNLLATIKQQPEELVLILEQVMESIQDYQIFLNYILEKPHHNKDSNSEDNFWHITWNQQQHYWQSAMELLHNTVTQWETGQLTPILDKRFSHESWVNNPFSYLLSQQYLLASRHLNTWLDNLNLEDKQLKKRILFFTRQYLDALSPTNFLYTNPQIMAETIDSKGKNLLRGLQNLIDDIQTNPLRLNLKMTTDHFKIGENIAITPGHVIFKNELIELIQYAPQTPHVKTIPLLIIPPWINKYYILDLSPHNSLVRWLVSQGITVFMISWVNPNEHYAHKSMQDYLNEGPIAAIKVIQTQMRVTQVNTLGFCLGGTLLAILLAYYAANNIDFVHSATFLASMIDFSDPGEIALYLDEKQVNKLERHMHTKGYLEGHVMASAFNSLRANDLIWSSFINNYLRAKKPIPFDILHWNSDSTNMPATMHSQYLRWMYVNNDLIKPGKIRINNTPLHIQAINVPTFFIATQKDHIAPWQTVYEGFRLLGGKKHFLLGGSGHIAGIVNPPTDNKYNYYFNNRCPKNPETWLKHAENFNGSWWPEWFKWLHRKSGRKIKALQLTESLITPIMEAPGEYVRCRLDEKKNDSI